MLKKSRLNWVGLLALSAGAYTGCVAKDAPAAQAIPPAVTAAPEPPPPPTPPPTPPPVTPPPLPSRPPQDRSRERSPERTLARGTRIGAAIERGITSRDNRTGETVRAEVNSNISDDRGRVVIPAGSTVSLTIERLEGGNRDHPDGQMVLSVSSVTINGDALPLHARVAPVAFHLEGRDGRNGDGGRSGRGTPDRDVVVERGTAIVLTLSQSLSISSSISSRQ